MNKKQLQQALTSAKEKAKKRNFKQGVEIVVNLRGLNLKNQEQRIDVFTMLPHETGKKVKVGCFSAPELSDQAKANCDEVVMHTDFKKYGDKKAVKKLADSCDWFLAQATIMPDVAKTFGRIFGPKAKMPNPKAGCVVPPNANLQALVARLKKTIRLQTREQYSIKAAVGKEDSDEEQVIDNMEAIYSTIVGVLPQGKDNIKDVIVKLTMGPAVKVGGAQ